MQAPPPPSGPLIFNHSTELNVYDLGANSESFHITMIIYHCDTR
jgi:hypothetical protein